MQAPGLWRQYSKFFFMTGPPLTACLFMSLQLIRREFEDRVLSEPFRPTYNSVCD